MKEMQQLLMYWIINKLKSYINVRTLWRTWPGTSPFKVFNTYIKFLNQKPSPHQLKIKPQPKLIQIQILLSILTWKTSCSLILSFRRHLMGLSKHRMRFHRKLLRQWILMLMCMDFKISLKWSLRIALASFNNLT